MNLPYNKRSRLIQIIQCYFVTGYERAVGGSTEASQHPGIWDSVRSWRTGYVDSAYATITFVAAGTAAVRTIRIISMAETDTVPYFVCNHGGHEAFGIVFISFVELYCAVWIPATCWKARRSYVISTVDTLNVDIAATVAYLLKG